MAGGGFASVAREEPPRAARRMTSRRRAFAGVGAVAHEAVPDYLAALDTLVLPSCTTSTWAEQFGHVLIEAMAAGLPVMGSSSAAISEVVADAGLLFPRATLTDCVLTCAPCSATGRFAER